MAVETWKLDATRRSQYEVKCVENILDPENPSLLGGSYRTGRRFLVLDGGIPGDVLDKFGQYFSLNSVHIGSVVLAGGEACKTLDCVAQIITALEGFELQRRNEPIVVIGGGAVLDVGGFAASIYRRGVPFIKIPTTLLAYVDAAIGIKNAVNVDGLKNLIGSFRAPDQVLLCEELLRGLPLKETLSGAGEILKLAVGCDGQLFKELESEILDVAASHVRSFSSGLVKSAVVTMLRELSSNLYESELARTVDLGHTFSQPIELAGCATNIRHGEAVAADVLITTAIGTARGIVSDADGDRIVNVARCLIGGELLRKVAAESLWRSVGERCRHRGGMQRIPIPRAIGTCSFINDLSFGELRAGLETAARWLA